MLINARQFIDALQLQILSPSSRTEWDIHSAELNRPGLQFVGYYEHFAYDRPQMVGLTEMSYLEQLSDEERHARLDALFSYPIPCVILCRGMMPQDDILELAKAHDVCVLRTESVTTSLVVNAMNYLNRAIAPRSTLHGVLVDVYGVGVLITGESGVGKSEAALELVKRGHQLVADDVVDICRITDINAMYVISAVLMSKSIDLVIHLENWKEKKAYDRLGLAEDFTTIMDVRVPHVVLPVRPGRNLAVVIEVAARNYSLKQMGYSAAQELDRRLNEMMMNAARG